MTEKDVNPSINTDPMKKRIYRSPLVSLRLIKHWLSWKPFYHCLETYTCMMENSKIRILALDFARNDRMKKK